MIICLVGDLLVRSKIDLAARHYGVQARFPSTEHEFLTILEQSGPRTRLVVLDLDAPGIDGPGIVSKARQGTSARIVGFCSHVLTDLIRAARAGGCDTVMANSTFAASIPGLVSEAVSNDTNP